MAGTILYLSARAGQCASSRSPSRFLRPPTDPLFVQTRTAPSSRSTAARSSRTRRRTERARAEEAVQSELQRASVSRAGSSFARRANRERESCLESYCSARASLWSVRASARWAVDLGRSARASSGAFCRLAVCSALRQPALLARSGNCSLPVIRKSGQLAPAHSASLYVCMFDLPLTFASSRLAPLGQSCAARSSSLRTRKMQSASSSADPAAALEGTA